ncbi:Cdc7p-Dbf4p kinase complex regulatory subunit [Mycoemilia scoparia]|uniref:Cdc7p-Dbf4p kinase complex regulatory subunit n=1 Tax=Mycoemilia scoparia TaxID=417184 RepID=A0A9W8DQ37_9FUNG|nr:Cdc7p-Dbf4p kinase complex regulatory subunit [Mycoemilia scoparia]
MTGRRLKFKSSLYGHPGASPAVPSPLHANTPGTTASNRVLSHTIRSTSQVNYGYNAQIFESPTLSSRTFQTPTRPSRGQKQTTPSRVLQPTVTPQRTAASLQKQLLHQGCAQKSLMRDSPSLTSPSLATSRRRIALDQITDREQAHSNMQSNVSGVGAAAAAGGNLALSLANTMSPGHAATSQQIKKGNNDKFHDWILSWRKAFPTFVFYFDGLNDSIVQKLKPQIQQLGGSTEVFFSVQTVTHVIVSDASKVPPPMVRDDNNVPIGWAQPTSFDINSKTPAVLARRFNIRVWHAEKLQNGILRHILPHLNQNAENTPSMQRKRKFGDVLAAERLNATRFGHPEFAQASQNRDFVYLKHLYILVEDKNHLYRPPIVQDFREPHAGQDPPWPKLYMVPQGRCPFVPHHEATSSKNSETEADAEKEQNEDDEDDDGDVNEDEEDDEEVEAENYDDSESEEINAKENKTPKLNLIRPLPPLYTPQPASIKPLIPPVSSSSKPKIPSYATPGRRIIGTTKVARSPQVHAPQLSNIIDSNASGMARSRDYISTSIALTSVQGNQAASKEKTADSLSGTKLETLSKRQQTVLAGQKMPKRRDRSQVPITRTKKPKAPTKTPVISRPGYCENCKVKYEDMNDHIKSVSHRKFASTSSNWKELDDLLCQVTRPPRKIAKRSSDVILRSDSSQATKVGEQFGFYSKASECVFKVDEDTESYNNGYRTDVSSINHHLNHVADPTKLVIDGIQPKVVKHYHRHHNSLDTNALREEKALPLLNDAGASFNAKALTGRDIAVSGPSHSFGQTAEAIAELTNLQQQFARNINYSAENISTPIRLMGSSMSQATTTNSHVAPVQQISIDSSSSASTVYHNSGADPFGIGINSTGTETNSHIGANGRYQSTYARCHVNDSNAYEGLSRAAETTIGPQSTIATIAPLSSTIITTPISASHTLGGIVANIHGLVDGDRTLVQGQRRFEVGKYVDSDIKTSYQMLHYASNNVAAIDQNYSTGGVGGNLGDAVIQPSISYEGMDHSIAASIPNAHMWPIDYIPHHHQHHSGLTALGQNQQQYQDHVVGVADTFEIQQTHEFGSSDIVGRPN